MELKQYRVYVECGYYYGGGTDGAWCSSTDQMFETIVSAAWPQKAVEIAQAQFGGPTKCHVTFRGEA